MKGKRWQQKIFLKESNLMLSFFFQTPFKCFSLWKVPIIYYMNLPDPTVYFINKGAISQNLTLDKLSFPFCLCY